MELRNWLTARRRKPVVAGAGDPLTQHAESDPDGRRLWCRFRWAAGAAVFYLILVVAFYGVQRWRAQARLEAALQIDIASGRYIDPRSAGSALTRMHAGAAWALNQLAEVKLPRTPGDKRTLDPLDWHEWALQRQVELDEFILNLDDALCVFEDIDPAPGRAPRFESLHGMPAAQNFTAAARPLMIALWRLQQRGEPDRALRIACGMLRAPLTVESDDQIVAALAVHALNRALAELTGLLVAIELAPSGVIAPETIQAAHAVLATLEDEESVRRLHDQWLDKSLGFWLVDRLRTPSAVRWAAAPSSDRPRLILEREAGTRGALRDLDRARRERAALHARDRSELERALGYGLVEALANCEYDSFPGYPPATVWCEALHGLRRNRALLAIRLAEAVQGRRPATLDELVPAFLSALPPDTYSYDGRPFAYVAQGPAARLYSVAYDGVDDGGRCTAWINGEQDATQGDLVVLLDPWAPRDWPAINRLLLTEAAGQQNQTDRPEHQPENGDDKRVE